VAAEDHSAEKKIILIGNPNVGKSIVFRLLTGSYVLVSNFPGTTVEITRGRMQLGGITYEVVDTPGVNSLLPQSEDERVTCEVLLEERPDLIIQVADAKNLRRTLLLTSQLVEFGIPMVLVMNMMDEAHERGVEINTRGLSEFLAIAVVETVAIYSRGKRQLVQAIQDAKVPRSPLTDFGSGSLPPACLGDLGVSPRAVAMEWLALGDSVLARAMEKSLGQESVSRLRQIEADYRSKQRRSLARRIEGSRKELVDNLVARFKHKRESRLLEPARDATLRGWLALLLAGVMLFAWIEIGALLGSSTPLTAANQWLAETFTTGTTGQSSGRASFLRDALFGNGPQGSSGYGLVPEAAHFLLLIVPVIFPLGILLAKSPGFAHEMGVLTRRPVTGIPILILVLLLAYEFVGYTGAQTLVGLLEKILFGRYIVPLVQGLLPEGFFREFIVGKYGLVSMGLTYCIAIVLPVVGTFFITFGLLEDSGYLPRLSILTDRLMRIMGLNGKATLPMVLGLGCCTMATMTTRILNSRKERLIATLLLALGIPCSAQLGVILGIATGFSIKVTVTILGVVASQLLLVGFLASKLVAGRRSEFIFEIPPIRVPQLKNVMLKTGYRVRWYLKEAVPLFLYGTLVLFILDKVRVHGRSLLEWLQAALEPVLSGILHLPAEAAGIFVLGFLRRDYGAAGLYEMARGGMLSAQQTVISLIVITLFVPCLASFFMIAKEQGLRRALAITSFILPFAITVGGVVSWIVRTFGITFQ